MRIACAGVGGVGFDECTLLSVGILYLRFGVLNALDL